MPLYTYHYLTPSGKKRKGALDAENLELAKATLRQKQIMVTQIGQKKAKRHALQGEHLFNFTLQLAQLIKAGLPVYESLLAIEEECKDEPYHPILFSLCEQIQKGGSLSESMASHPKSFPHLYRAMVEAGESSGELSFILEKLAALQKRKLLLRKQLTSALLYPTVLAAFCLVVITLLLTFAVPSIKSLFEGRPLSGLTWFVLKASDHWYILPLIPLPLLYFATPKGRAKLPLINRLLILSSLVRFSRTFASLQKSGLTLIESLRLSREVMSHAGLKETMQRAEKRIIEGSSLSTELKREPLIPPLISRMLRVGEESGDLATMLEQIADHYEQELEKSLHRLTTLVQPVILIVMGGIVGLIMLAVLLPLTDVSNLMLCPT